MQKEGPGPGEYEYSAPDRLRTVSSSFKSRTPRFVTSHTASILRATVKKQVIKIN